MQQQQKNKILKNKEKGKKATSLFEIFILLISIVAIAYFVGDEFRIVSAQTTPTATARAGAPGPAGRSSPAGR